MAQRTGHDVKFGNKTACFCIPADVSDNRATDDELLFSVVIVLIEEFVVVIVLVLFATQLRPPIQSLYSVFRSFYYKLPVP